MELKTIDGWHKSGCGDWDTYCKPGELVDEGVADYFLDILPPRTMKKGYFQVGEHIIMQLIRKRCRAAEHMLRS